VLHRSPRARTERPQTAYAACSAKKNDRPQRPGVISSRGEPATPRRARHRSTIDPPTLGQWPSGRPAARAVSGDLPAGHGHGDPRAVTQREASGKGCQWRPASGARSRWPSRQWRSGRPAARAVSGDPAAGHGHGDPAAGHGHGDLPAGHGHGDPAAGHGHSDLPAGHGHSDLPTGHGHGDLPAGHGHSDPAAVTRRRGTATAACQRGTVTATCQRGTVTATRQRGTATATCQRGTVTATCQRGTVTATQQQWRAGGARQQRPANGARLRRPSRRWRAEERPPWHIERRGSSDPIVATATPWLRHRNRGTVTVTPRRWHRNGGTVTVTPRRRHRYGGTVTVAPWLWHRDRDTVTAAPWLWHRDRGTAAGHRGGDALRASARVTPGVTLSQHNKKKGGSVTRRTPLGHRAKAGRGTPLETTQRGAAKPREKLCRETQKKDAPTETLRGDGDRNHPDAPRATPARRLRRLDERHEKSTAMSQRHPRASRSLWP